MSSLKKLKNIKKIIESVMHCDLASNSRKRHNINAIKIYCFVCRKTTQESYSMIGHVINKSHATIIHHVKDFETILQYDVNLNNDTKFCMKLCREMLGQHQINYRDTVELYWTNLTKSQQQRLSGLVTHYYISNTKLDVYEELQ